MKKPLAIAAALAAGGMSTLAYAQSATASDTWPSAVQIDGYYVADSTLKISGEDDSSDVDGDGGGGRISIGLAQGFRLNGEYQAVTLDDVGGKLDANQLRAGLSWISDGRMRFGVAAEYVKLDFKIDTPFGTIETKPDGYGLHARGEADLNPWLQGYAQLGYVNLEESSDSADGFEYLIGLIAMPTRNVGAFVDYRGTKLDADGDSLKLNDLRAGVRLAF